MCCAPYQFIFFLSLNLPRVSFLLFTLFLVLSFCSADCGCFEARDHLVFKCNWYVWLWSLIASWLGLSTVNHGTLYDHFLQFSGLQVFQKFSPSLQYYLDLRGWIFQA